MTKAAFKKLQREWYSKCKGHSKVLGFEFQDIEFGRDLNEIPASTFRGTGGGTGMGSMTVSLIDPQEMSYAMDQIGTPFELHPIPEYWSRITEAAYLLRLRDPRRKVVLGCLRDGQVQTAKKLKQPLSRVAKVWHEFVGGLGLPERRNYTVLSHDEPAPAPVKKLTKRQVRKLQQELLPPKELK